MLEVGGEEEEEEEEGKFPICNYDLTFLFHRIIDSTIRSIGVVRSGTLLFPHPFPM
jgi:hypothetical protein